MANQISGKVDEILGLSPKKLLTPPKFHWSELLGAYSEHDKIIQW